MSSVQHVMQNIEELQRAATEQQAQCEDLQAQLASLQDTQQGLDERAQQASQVCFYTTTEPTLLSRQVMVMPEGMPNVGSPSARSKTVNALV